MHPEAFSWVERKLRNISRERMKEFEVVEIGSLDINGTIRSAFAGLPCPPAKYTGIDAQEGPGVDVVGDAADRDVWPLVSADLIVCMEVFEHTPAGKAICQNAYRNLMAGGIFLVTAAGHGRGPHSAVDGLTLRDGEYYQNVTEPMLCDWLDQFTFVELDGNSVTCDIYAMAVK